MRYYLRVFAAFTAETESAIGAAEALVRGLEVCRPPGVAEQLVPVEVSADGIHWTVHRVPLPEPSQADVPAEDWQARAEAAEARAAQAEADARLMAGLAFASFVARTSFSTEIVEAGLLDALEVASDRAAAVSDADLIAAARRILAGVQPTPSPTAT